MPPQLTPDSFLWPIFYGNKDHKHLCGCADTPLNKISKMCCKKLVKLNRLRAVCTRHIAPAELSEELQSPPPSNYF